MLNNLFIFINNMYLRSFLLVSFLVSTGHLTFAQSHKTIHVLFLGNSYTYVNNLPQLIYDIALSNGDTLVFDSNCPGGHTFQNHFTNTTSINKINAQAWDFVVLQAQSQEPSFPPNQVASETLPYALKLDSLIHRNDSCSQTIFFETWGRKNGDASNCPYYPPVCTYSGMQGRLRESYKLFADTCHTIMAPVGEAWKKSVNINAALNLYQADESHPSLEGSYLTACVFYEVLFGRTVLNSSYTANISMPTAMFLQQTAHDMITDSLDVWNIGKYNPCISNTDVQTILPDTLITLYPNPVNNTVNISVPDKWVINKLAYRIFDLTGNRCLSGYLDSRSINVSELPSSMYFIEIDTGTNVYFLKFLKP